MTTFNTGNPIGSTNPKDLYDNAENLDVAVNSPTSRTWVDRLGVTRLTLQGFNDDAQSLIAQANSELNTFESNATAALAGLGYLPPVDYASGLDMATSNQTVTYDGQVYAPISSELPFTTSGTFEADKFRLVAGVNGADLAGAGGALMVGYANSGTPITAQMALDILYHGVANIRNPRWAGGSNGGNQNIGAQLAAALASNKNVMLPAGTYTVTDLDMLNERVIYGAGAGNTVLNVEGTINFRSVRKAGLRGMKVVLKSSGKTLVDFSKDPIAAAGSFENYCEDVIFEGSTDLTGTLGLVMTDSYINTFVNCHFILFGKNIQFNIEAHRNNFFGCTVRSSLTYGEVLLEANGGYANSFTGTDFENCNRILDMNGGQVAFGEGCYFEAHNAAFGIRLNGGHASFHESYFNEVFIRLGAGGSLDLSRNWVKASTNSNANSPMIRTIAGFNRLILDNNTQEGLTYLLRADPTVYNYLQVYDEGAGSWVGSFPTDSQHIYITDTVYDVTSASLRQVEMKNIRATRGRSEGYVEGRQRFDGGAGGVQLTSSAWNYNPLRMGSYYLWVDATGKLRIKSSAPTSDTDGAVVGAQT